MSNLPKTIKKEQIFKSHFKYCLNKWFPDTIFLTQLSSFPNCTDVYHQICGHSTTTCDQILPVFDCQPRSRRQLWTSYLLPQCYRKWHFKAPLCITFKIKIWVVAYLKLCVVLICWLPYFCCFVSVRISIHCKFFFDTLQIYLGLGSHHWVFGPMINFQIARAPTTVFVNQQLKLCVLPCLPARWAVCRFSN